MYVPAETKKLSAKWSMESGQDLFADHGMNAENELMTALGDEIAREIDRDIIDALFAFAGAGSRKKNRNMKAALCWRIGRLTDAF